MLLWYPREADSLTTLPLGHFVLLLLPCDWESFIHLWIPQDLVWCKAEGWCWVKSALWVNEPERLYQLIHHAEVKRGSANKSRVFFNILSQPHVTTWANHNGEYSAFKKFHASYVHIIPTLQRSPPPLSQPPLATLSWYLSQYSPNPY